jgi:hypothetical protein
MDHPPNLRLPENVNEPGSASPTEPSGERIGRARCRRAVGLPGTRRHSDPGGAEKHPLRLQPRRMVTLPPGDWRIRLNDLDTGNTLFETESKAP